MRLLLLFILSLASITANAQRTMSKAELEQKAKQGDPYALFELGRNYYNCVRDAVYSYNFSESDVAILKKYSSDGYLWLEKATMKYKEFLEMENPIPTNILKRRQDELKEAFQKILAFYKDSPEAIAILNKARHEENECFLKAKEYLGKALEKQWLDAEEYVENLYILEKQP